MLNKASTTLILPSLDLLQKPSKGEALAEKILILPITYKRQCFAPTLAIGLLVLLLSEFLVINTAYSQTATQTNNPNSTIGSDSDANVVNQISPQNNAQNRNEINFPNIFPLNNPINTPVNTENDFGLNMSFGINTLDAANVTVYLGLIFQPGRTDSHKARMARLRSETELLESQKQVNQAQLQLLQKQIAEAELRLQRLQQSPDVVPPRSSGSTNDLKNPETVPMQSPVRN